MNVCYGQKMAHVPAVICAIAVLIAGCAKASDDAAAKRAPAVAPPGEVSIPPGLALSVTINGSAAPPIDAARLAASTPAFADAERRAWRVAQLVPEAAGAAIEARAGSGVSIRLEAPSADTHVEPVLFLTRRGDVVVSLVDPADPFPDYHGQGGRLRRQGDPLPRLSGVTSIAIVRPPPAAP